MDFNAVSKEDKVLLSLFKHENGLQLRELETETGIKSKTLEPVISELIKTGYIFRSKHAKDGRYQLSHATRKGIQVHNLYEKIMLMIEQDPKDITLTCLYIAYLQYSSLLISNDDIFKDFCAIMDEKTPEKMREKGELFSEKYKAPNFYELPIFYQRKYVEYQLFFYENRCREKNISLKWLNEDLQNPTLTGNDKLFIEYVFAVLENESGKPEKLVTIQKNLQSHFFHRQVVPLQKQLLSLFKGTIEKGKDPHRKKKDNLFHAFTAKLKVTDLSKTTQEAVCDDFWEENKKEMLEVNFIKPESFLRKYQKSKELLLLDIDFGDGNIWQNKLLIHTGSSMPSSKNEKDNQ